MREKEILLQSSILDVLQEPFFILGRKGELVDSNPGGMEILGYPWEELQKRHFQDFVASENQMRMSEGVEEMLQGKGFRTRAHLIHRSGGRIPVELFGRPTGEFFFLTVTDLRERVRTEGEWERTKKDLLEKIRERDQYARELQVLRDLYKEKLKEIEKMKEEAVLLSYTDDLTAIYNHRFFIQQLAHEVDRVKRYPAPLALLMLDIDYFKHYNDANGHLAGDQVLKTIALLIQYGVRQTDFVARYGGEEFSAILINAERGRAREIAERIRKLVADTRFPNEASQPNGDLTVSIGVATLASSVSTLTDLIREADNALYQAKRAGRNRTEG